MLERNLFSVMWLAWALYWLILSRNVKQNVRREPLVSRLAHALPLTLAALLLAAPRIPIAALNVRFVPHGGLLHYWLGVLLCAAGLLFTVWARGHLGRNWSGIVTLKCDHELVTTGPYAIVRHPIYTGLLLAFAGTALARGDVRGILAVAIAFAALWRKLRFEERWMREQFGSDYAAYSARVAALVPFLM